MNIIAEEMDGRVVLVLHRSERYLSLIEAPDGVLPEQMVSGIAEPEEGPYTVIDDPTLGYHQRLIESYFLHRPGQTRDEAMEELGIDEESLIPRY